MRRVLVVWILCCVGLALVVVRQREENYDTNAMYAAARPMPLPPIADRPAPRSLEAFLNARKWNVRNILRPQHLKISYVYANGNYVLRYTYLGGKVGSDSSGTIFANPDNLFPATRATLIFKVRFPTSFDFVRGGKLMGLSLGTVPGGHATGGAWKPKGGSVRLTWKPSDTTPGSAVIKGYVYHAVTRAPGRSAPQTAYDRQGVQTRRVMDVAKSEKKGNDVWYSRGAKISVSKGTWHELALTVVLNTPGRADGVLEIRCTPENGTSVVASVNDFYFRDTGDVLLQEVMLMSFFGGSDQSYAPPRTMAADFKDFKTSIQ
jgi:hypothetical protein